jgi:CRP-like cAMP-binding protein
MLHALALRPDDLPLRQKLGDLYYHLGQVPHAVECYRVTAGAYAARGDLLQAMALCRAILQVDPRHTETQQALAELYARQTARSQPVLMATPLKANAFPVGAVELPRETTTRPGAVVRGVVIPTPALPAVPPSSTTSVDPSALPRVPLFSDLSRNAFVWLLERLDLHHVEAGATITEENEFGDSLFIVASGSVRVERARPEGPPLVLNRLGPASFLGEIALLGSGVRSATVVAEEPTDVFELTRETLDQLVELYPSVKQVMHRFYRDRLFSDLCKTSPLFAAFQGEQLRDIAARFKEVEVDRGTRLQTEGKPVDALYVVFQGRCDVSRKVQGRRVVLTELREGDVLGVTSFLTGEPAATTVTTRCKSTVLRLPARSARDLMAAHPRVAELLRLTGDSAGKALEGAVGGSSGAKETSRAHMQGDLAQVKPTSLLVFLEMERMSGVLRLCRRGQEATLYVKTGRVLDVEKPGGVVEQPADFVGALLAWDAGEFQFSFEPVDREDRVRTATMALLLDAARLQDEANRTS